MRRLLSADTKITRSTNIVVVSVVVIVVGNVWRSPKTDYGYDHAHAPELCQKGRIGNPTIFMHHRVRHGAWEFVNAMQHIARSLPDD